MRSIPPRYTDDAMDAFRRHTWPGNVRELKGVVTRLIVMRSGDLLSRGDIAPILDPGHPDADGPVPLTLAAAERAHIAKVLALTRGVIAGRNGAAAVLGVPRSTLQYRLRKYGLVPRDAA
jgi:formate hydrogenlyase transcriptional activator